MQKLFVIGAMKSGTSTVYNLLKTHPNVAMARGKELNYFVGGEAGSPCLPNYDDNFDLTPDTLLMGEASPIYTYNRKGNGVAQKIKERFPNAKIAYILRDPLERMESHYAHMLRAGQAGSHFFEEVKDDAQYFNTSDYATQLEPYLNLFGKEQCRVLSFTHLKKEPVVFVNELLEWLEIRPLDPELITRRQFNVSDKKIPVKDQSVLGHSLYQLGRKCRKSMPFLTKKQIAAVKSIITRKGCVDFNSADFAKERNKVQAHFQEDFRRMGERLQAMGFDVSKLF